MKHYTGSGALMETQTSKLIQGSSGGDITFGPNIDSNVAKVNPGDYFAFTAQGLNASGTAVATGQIGFTGNNTQATNSTFYLWLAALNNSGQLTYMPGAYYTNLVIGLVSSDGLGDNYNYSYSALSNAVTNNSVLSQYAQAGNLIAGSLANAVQAAGINTDGPIFSINGKTIYTLGGNLGAWDPMAIRAAANATVNVHVSVNGGAFYVGDTFDINANQPLNLDQWSWGLGNNVSSLNTTKLYFTNSSNQAIAGLQVATLPVSTGGILPESAWVNVGSTSNTAMTVYSGTVSQILNVNDASGFLYIQDTIENIKAAGTQLYNLVTSGRIIGSTWTDGFDAIPLISTGALSSIAISDGAGHTAYIHMTRSGTYLGTMEHSVLAFNPASYGSSADLYIDNIFVKYVGSSTSGPSGFKLNSDELSSLTQNQIHTLRVSSGQIGVVPPGGGLDISFANNLQIWVGDAKALPTSLSDIQANTLYIIHDGAQQIIELNGYASIMTGVINTLANKGYLAYSVDNSMTSAQVLQLQQSNNNMAIANVGKVHIDDTLFSIENTYWNQADGQHLGIIDSYARLMSPILAKGAKAVSDGNLSNTVLYSSSLQEAFDNHRITLNDSLTTLTNTAKLNNLASAYYGTGQLRSVVVTDTVASLSKISSQSQVSDLINFVKTYAHGILTIEVSDTEANIYNALVGSNASNFITQLNTAFNASGITLNAQISIHDTVANIEAAYNAGHKKTIGDILDNNSFWSNGYSGLAVEDTIANINNFLNSGSYVEISSKTKSYIVVDSAANVLKAIQSDNWGEAIGVSDNIVVKDTFANIQANAADLFTVDYRSPVSKLVFTDITGADANHPLIIAPYMSEDGLMPLLDFSKASALQGNVSVTESALTGSALTQLQSLYAYTRSAVALSITDTAGHTVIVDVLSNRTEGDPNNNDLNNIVLAENISRANIYHFNTIADSTISAPDLIPEFHLGIDKLDFSQIDANTSLAGSQHFTFTGSTASAHSIWYATSGNDIVLYANDGGGNTADMAIKLAGIHSINTNDLIL